MQRRQFLKTPALAAAPLWLGLSGELQPVWATSAQHQIDHLAGKMFFDHLSPLKRKMLIAKADKWRKRG